MFSTCSNQGPVLTHWSQFDNILSRFANPMDATPAQDWNNLLQLYTTKLQELCPDDDDGIDAEAEQQGAPTDKLRFLVEQLKLLTMAPRRYSSDTLLWSFQIFALSPAAYSSIRESYLTLPHPSYLKKLASVFTIKSGIKDNDVHEQYLTQKCASLSEDERRVVVMLDEIHITSKLSYKGGKLEGPAVNVPLSEASTAQVFMTSSILSKAKDVAAIIPVKNLNGDLLKDLCTHILQLLHRAGYSVLCLISDNNRINRKALIELCGGTLQLSIPHPLSPNEKLFFLFDTVHIFKCIRNNWLCQKDNMKTFAIPACDDTGLPIGGDDDVLYASFGHLRLLHDHEKASPLKLAPALNQKALHPTNTEKQNVGLMLKVR